jgi:hypothetical protein
MPTVVTELMWNAKSETHCVNDILYGMSVSYFRARSEAVVLRIKRADNDT